MTERRLTGKAKKRKDTPVQIKQQLVNATNTVTEIVMVVSHQGIQNFHLKAQYSEGLCKGFFITL